MTDLPIQSLLFRALDAVEQLQIPYMIMGGFAVRTWGIPRPTYDADVAIACDEDRLQSLFDELEKRGFDIPIEHRKGYLDSVAMLSKVKATCFQDANVWEVDLFLVRGEFLESALSRRREATLAGRRVWVMAPEDVILLKLIASRRKDLLDIEEILTVTREIDGAYLARWAGRLGVAERLREFWRDPRG